MKEGSDGLSIEFEEICWSANSGKRKQNNFILLITLKNQTFGFPKH